MKSVLIVVPSSGIGGVLSSLKALLNSTFVDRYYVNIFVMNAYGKKMDPLLSKFDIGNNFWTSKVYSYVQNAKGIKKFLLSFYKVLFRIPYIGRKIINHIELRTIHRIEKKDYECIISFQESISMQFVSKFTNSNKIAWIHCDYSRIYTNELDEMLILSKYKKIVTVSKYTKESMCNLFPQLRSRIHTVYNILDSHSILLKANQPIEDLRFQTEGFTIISVGRISAVKQFDLIPMVAYNLRLRGYSFRWYIIGGVNEKNAFDKLSKSITDYNVRNHVICLGNKSNPYPYFKNANILVSTSLSEACPMIFNEAKILKLPIVTNNFPSAFEFIHDRQDGRICSIDQMADVLADIIQQKITFTPLFSNDFNPDVIQGKIDHIIND